MIIELLSSAILAGTLAYASFRQVDQTERGLVERFGKFNRYVGSGMLWVIPLVENVRKVNVTQKMVNINSMEMITKDSLNCVVSAQAYYRIRDEEKAVCSSQYKVSNIELQIVSLAQTTLRNIIGTMELNDANSQRGKINNDLFTELKEKTEAMGVELLQTEIREITPPNDVQEVMNNVVKAQKQKIASVDLALARQNQADGERMAAIKVAEGQQRAQILTAEAQKQSQILVAEGLARAIQLQGEAADKYFTGNAQVQRKLEVTENALRNGKIYFLDPKVSLMNVIGDMSGTHVLPVKQ